MTIINRISTVLCSERVVRNRNGFAVAVSARSARCMEQLRDELFEFTHIDGHLSQDRVIALRQQGFEHEVINDPDLGQIGYAVKFPFGWVAYAGAYEHA